jgi:sulfite oxidase
MTNAPKRLTHDPLNSATWPVPADDFLTPAARFFTRSHAATPRIDRDTWRLEVAGLVERPATFSFEELVREFPGHEETATMVCAGLRRDEFLSIGPLPGELPWGPEPASNGHWAGIRLRDVLQRVGVGKSAKYVEFIGLDRVERHGETFGFGGSIDLEKALRAEVLLASELNGAPLPADHGFPVRAVVPGWIGARSVKWLGKIILSETPSRNYFQTKAYRFQRTTNPNDIRDVTSGSELNVLPLNAVILWPTRDEVVPSGSVKMRGWAMGSAGRQLRSIEVSANAGRDWYPARVARPPAEWSWTFWEAELDLSPGRHVLAARASDCSGETQPAAVGDMWNVKGYMNNAWHLIPVRAE